MNEIAEIFPTPERYAHGPIERDDRNQDDHGNVSRPHRAIDILAAMERRGAITGDMRQAGEDFRAMFHRATLDPLQCSDVGRPMVSGRKRNSAMLASRIEDAREGIWRAVLAVGGLGSAGGSCVWHVLGWQRSIKEWALEQGWNGRRVSQEAASGILIAALGVLEKHFEKNS